MADYHILNATLRQIIPNIENKKFSILAEAEDGRYFQIKLCEVGQKHNINEFISHYVGTEIGAPMIEGAFLYLPPLELDKIMTFMDTHKGLFSPVDLSICKESVFFAIEWKKDIIEIREDLELWPRVCEATNRNSFYSLYPFDQFLKNYDRHIGNHLIIKQANTIEYKLIDFDRIFGSTTWDSIPLIINDFGCLSLKDYHRFLYSLVDNNGYSHVLHYSNNISTLSAESISDIITTILQIYTASQNEVGMIHKWLSGRSPHIYDKCLENNDCFINVKQKRLQICSSMRDQEISIHTDTHLSNIIIP